MHLDMISKIWLFMTKEPRPDGPESPGKHYPDYNSPPPVPNNMCPSSFLIVFQIWYTTFSQMYKKYFLNWINGIENRAAATKGSSWTSNPQRLVRGSLRVLHSWCCWHCWGNVKQCKGFSVDLSRAFKMPEAEAAVSQSLLCNELFKKIF